MTDALRRKIHVGCKQLGLDQDTRRDLQLVVTGKASMSDMTEAEMLAMVRALEERGFKATSTGRSKGRHKPAPRADLRLVHVLWRLLGDAGHLREPGRDGLNRFIRRRFGAAWDFVPRDVDDLTEHRCITDLIRALQDWCEREDVPGYNRGDHR